jgi:hypothetical protein
VPLQLRLNRLRGQRSHVRMPSEGGSVPPAPLERDASPLAR